MCISKIFVINICIKSTVVNSTCIFYRFMLAYALILCLHMPGTGTRLHVSVYMCQSTCASLRVPVYVCQFTWASLHSQVWKCQSTCASLHVPVYMCQFTCVSLHMLVYIWQSTCVSQKRRSMLFHLYQLQLLVYMYSSTYLTC